MPPATQLAHPPDEPHSGAMRTISDDAAVRLYHLDDEGGTATTLFYGPLAEACRIAAQQNEATQAGLYLQTSNDVVAWLDFID